MNKLYLHSSQASNNTYTLDQPITGKYRLLGFNCTNNIFNVNDTNNKIYINENSVNLIGNLTNGYYDASDFITMCSSVLNGVCSGTISISRNSNTNKLTIDNDGFSFYFSFGTNTTNSARKLLGFDETDGTNSTAQTSNIPIDLNTCKSFFINISDNDDKDIQGINFFNTSFFIQGTGGFGEILRYIVRDNFEQIIKFSRGIKKIEIEFHDLNNNSVDLNSEYEILFEKL